MTKQKRNAGSCERDQAGAQHARFLETARALGCDEDEAAFDEKLALVARAKPKDEGQKSGKLRPKKSET